MAIANFFIAGVPRAGTTAIHDWISDHPDAVGAIGKETYFFADPGTHMSRRATGSELDLSDYERHFPARPGPAPRIFADSTPAYIYHAEALRRIPDLPTRPKCLFVVREPAAQIYSLYQYFRNNWTWIPPEMSFRRFVGAVREGSHAFSGNELACNALQNAVYADFLERWRDRLGPERFRVCTFENVVGDPKGFAASIAEWIGLDPLFYDGYAFRRQNEAYLVRNQRVNRMSVALRSKLPRGRVYDAIRRTYRKWNTRAPAPPGGDDLEMLSELRDQYRPHNERLARSFGLDLSTW